MQQRDLLRRFTSHDVAPGTVVINEGEEGRGLFVVLSGELDVSRRTGRWHDRAARRPQDRRRVRRDVDRAKRSHHGDRRRDSARRPCCSSRASTSSRIVAGVPEIRSYLEALAEDREIDNQLVARRGRNSGGRANSDLGPILGPMTEETAAEKKPNGASKILWLLVAIALVFLWWYFRPDGSHKVAQPRRTADAAAAIDPRRHPRRSQGRRVAARSPRSSATSASSSCSSTTPATPPRPSSTARTSIPAQRGRDHRAL